MPTYTEKQLDALEADLDEIRRELPIPWVLHKFGHEPALVQGNRLSYHSPFRPDDEHPSFDVYPYNGGVRCGDLAEVPPRSGGVIDLVGWLIDADTDAEAIDKARVLYAEFVEDDWSGPEIKPERSSLNLKELEQQISAGDTAAAVRALAALDKPGIENPAEVVRQWRLTYGNTLIAPYYDHNDKLVGALYRLPSGEKRRAKGMRLNTLYGAWRYTKGDTVVLCEGESDCWSVPPGYTALGVPGAAVSPEKLHTDFFEGSVVIVAFDGDEAGRAATRRWARHLADTNSVLVAALPEGKDLAAISSDRVRDILSAARPLFPAPARFAESETGYVRLPSTAKGAAEQVSNWRLQLTRVVRDNEGGVGYEGVLLPHHRKVVLPVEAMSSTTQMVRWCTANGCSWQGGAADHQRLLQLLQHESSFLPEGRMTRQVGLHGGDFVWPTGYIGTEDWTYVPPPSRIDLTSRVRIENVPCEVAEVLSTLKETYDWSIVGPMMAWMAVAPLRPLFHQFPILSVSGASGTGKTTLTELFLDVMTGSRITTNLSSTTPYAVSAFFACANAVPVWFDEYRPGAHEGAMSQLNQLIRDSYTGQPSFKGGQTENKAEVTAIPTVVPVVVSGEDSFVETSHTDRMVMLRLVKTMQGTLPEGDWGWEGYAYAYLKWLFTTEDWSTGTINVRPRGPAELNDRQRMNIGVLQFGRNLLWHFVEDLYDTKMADLLVPELDLSGVVAQADEARQTNPTIEAIEWALGADLRDEPVWEEDGVVYVHPVSLLYEARKTGAFVLPVSNASGLRKLLIDQHHGEDARVRRYGKQIRVIKLPLTEVL